MAQEMPASEILAAQETYLVQESDKHKADIKRAEGQVQEIDELLERVRNTCIYCCERIYNYRDDNRMATHIEDKHSE